MAIPLNELYYKIYEAEIKNEANSKVVQAERLLKDFEGKISDDDKKKLEDQKKEKR